MKYICTFLLFLGVTLSSQAELVSKMEYFVIKKDKDNQEVLKSTPRVFPGEVVLYKMTFENTENEILKDVEVNGLIPNVTNYIKGSESKQDNEIVMFSIDNGTTWSEKPMKKVVKDGVVKEIAAETFEYTNIKWKIPSFKEKETKLFEYRVMIKN